MVKRTMTIRIAQAFAVVAVAVVLLGAVATGPALAARGGKGGGKPSTSAAALTVSPNPVASGAAFTVSGSGFAPNTTVYVGPQGYFALNAVTVDGSGRFTVSYSGGFSVPGTYTFVALVYSQRSWVIGASATLTVT